MTTLASPPPYRVESLRHVGEWTSRDPDLRGLDLAGTDLGVSFPFTASDGQQQLAFVFGDTHTFGPFQVGRWDENSIAVAPYEWEDRDRLPPLNWLTREDGQFLGLLIPGEDLRAMEVSLDGVQIGDRVLLFFNRDFRNHRHHYLLCAAAPEGRFDQLQPRFRQRTDRFLNVSLSPDPHDPETIWVFGTGHYRVSPIYLARAPAATLDDFSTWRFLAGEGWADDESAATPVLDGRIGELSARYVPAAESWALMYQRAQGPSGYGHHIGVYARFAPHPTGPWSDELPVLLPTEHVGYTQYFHAKESAVGFCDGLSQPGRAEEWGGPYGAYLVPEWSRVIDGRLHLVFTLSSWNPYQVHLMEAVLANDEDGIADFRLPIADLDVEIGNWQLAIGNLARRSSFVIRHFDEQPWLWLESGGAHAELELTVPHGAKWLTFRLRGGGIRARLVDDAGHLVRESRGRDEVREARWRIDGFAGRAVTFQVVGDVSDELAAGGITEPEMESP